jgi:glycine/D-amino acid oxidase-like deaminating enzyme/nitrite reductase/ring-hydroxylating ferredoxin subunit
MEGSLWMATAPASDRPRAVGEHSFDTVVVGGGITGLTTALLLAREGRAVAVLEQGRIGAGTTGGTTGKVTSQHSLTYDGLRRSRGDDAARIYGEANERAKEWIAETVAEESIECDFRRRSAYVYASSAAEREDVEREATAAARAGLPARFVDEVPLPFATAGAVRFDDQAELHPLRYLAGLARVFEADGGRIFESSRAVGVNDGKPCVVETEEAAISAEHVVIATLLPFLDRGLFFARAFAHRSYAIAARISEPPPEAMLISAGSPTRSIRAHPAEGGELLLVGGEGHRTGSGDAVPERYERLEEFARAHWDVLGVEHRWSAQDYASADDVPLIGPLHPWTDRIHVATGFRKWGLTAGTVAAMLINDAIAGRANAWAGLFSSTRVGPASSLPHLAAENGHAGLAFVAERILRPGRRPIDDLRPGEGGIVASSAGKVAAYRDEQGGVHAVSSRCTHLGCQVRWNAAERTWDCPCHGSRFAVDGEVLAGPAVRPLERREP